MLARLRAWWQKISKYPVVAILVFVASALGLALIVVLVLGYWLNWHWTGLSQKTLWDWLQLLIIPLVLAVAALLFNLANSRTEQQIALDNQRETALQAYIDTMSELLLEKHLRESKPEDEVRTIARVRTLRILPRLDADRKRSVLQFLYEAGLIFRGKNIVDLSGADLSKAVLSEACLQVVDLREANLSGANLHKADLARADLTWADLSGANLSEAFLLFAHLSGADLREAFLFGTDLSGVDLSGARLYKACLERADLEAADLRLADLAEANLCRATITSEQWNTAKSLQGATMPDGSIHP